MRVLVTGGAGFIGSNVVREALASGWSVTVLDDFSTGFRENCPAVSSVRIIQGDIRDAATVAESLAEVEAVFHLAASVGNVRSIQDPLLDAEINVLGTIRLLEGMRRADVRRLVFSSSAAIYGEPRRLPIDERHPVKPDSPYGVSKLAAEKECLCYGRLYAWQVTCLRYFNVYGVNQRYDAYGNVIPIFASRLRMGEPLLIYGDGNQTRDFVDVEDVARMNRLALQTGVSGTFNVASGVATTINDLATLMQACAGRSVEIRHEAPRPGEVRHSVADLTAIRGSFHEAPAVPLRAGLARYLAWDGRVTSASPSGASGQRPPSSRTDKGPGRVGR
jgi:UDP-glucose 4-epimerase